MPELRIAGKDFFARGIERILSRQGERPSQLPDLPMLPPIEWPGSSSLARALATRSFEDDVQAVLRPSVGDRHLLRPGPFSRALADAKELLEYTRSQLPPGNDAGRLEVLDRAIRQLQEEQVLRDLAFGYRAALYAA